MVDGGDDEAGISERRGRIMMKAEPAGTSMRDDDERELVAGDRTILYARHREAAKHYFLRGRGTRGPHDSRYGRSLGVGRHIDELETGGPDGCRRATQRDDERELVRAHRPQKQVLLIPAYEAVNFSV